MKSWYLMIHLGSIPVLIPFMNSSPKTLGGSACVCNLIWFDLAKFCKSGGTTQQLFKLTWKFRGLIVDWSKSWKKMSVSKSHRPIVVTWFWSFSVKHCHILIIWAFISCLFGSLTGFLASSSSSSSKECAPMPMSSMPSLGTLRIKLSIFSTPGNVTKTSYLNELKYGLRLV